MKKYRKYIERLVEYVLRGSGAVTSVTIVLIALFLFTEGAGLFRAPAVEQGYSLYTHSANPVRHISHPDIRRIFDQELLEWSQLDGRATGEIHILRIDDIFNHYSPEEIGDDYSGLSRCVGDYIERHPEVLAFLPDEYVPQSPSIHRIDTGNIKPKDFFAASEWMPTAQPVHLYGILPILLGTLLVSLLSIVIALPLGLGVAIYLSELAGPRVRQIFRPAIELLAGIPSVVYGFWGLVVLVPWIQTTFDLPVGETALAGGLLLAIMALPTIISVAQDAISSVPSSMREASLALGASHWQTITRVVLPYARSGISAALVLGIGRAIGETMAVLMVTGNAAVMPSTVLESVRTIPATIVAELGEVPVGSTHYQALFLLGAILFLMTMVISIVSEVISSKQRSISN